MDIFISEFYDEMRKVKFESYGILDSSNRIHTLGTDSKIIGRIFEMFSQPVLNSIAKRHGLLLTTPESQTVYPDFILNIQAFFEETGTTGIRESVVYEIYRRQNPVRLDDDPFAGWARDPYDETIREGSLMNLSEQEQFDEQFPEFPCPMKSGNWIIPNVSCSSGDMSR